MANDLVTWFAARYVLGEFSSESLPDVATELLLARHDGFALLAGAARTDHPSELRAMFEAALRKSGLDTLPEPLQAARIVVQQAAREVADGLVEAPVGAATIMGAFFAVRELLPGELLEASRSFGIAELVSAYYTFDAASEDDPRYLSLRQALEDECRSLLAPLAG